jgi:hypothetical protein
VSDESARVDVLDADNVVSLQVIVEALRRAPVRDDAARLAHDKTFDPRLARFDIGFVDTVVSDQRISHADDLTGVARVGQNLLISAHRCVENHLAERFAVSAKRRTVESASVF